MKSLFSFQVFMAVSIVLLACNSKQLILIDDYRYSYEEKKNLKIYLVRHAEAYENIPKEKRSKDLPDRLTDALTPFGEKESMKMAFFFRDKKIAAVISSSSGRSRQTAEVISKTASLSSSVLIYPEFNPLKGGDFFDENEMEWEWRLDQWRNGNDPKPYGGENLSDGTERALSAIDSLLKEYTDQSIVIVSHDEIIATLIGQAAQTPLLERIDKHKVANGTVSQILLGSDQTLKLLSENEAIP